MALSVHRDLPASADPSPSSTVTPAKPAAGAGRNIYADGSYEQSNPTWHEEDAPWKAARIASILSDNKVRFDSVAEVGCGTGEICARLSEAFPQAQFAGYEVSPQAYARACQRARPGLDFHLKDIRTENRSFDVLLVIDVIEHVDDYLGFTRSLRDCAAYKVFHIPLDLSVQSLLRLWPIMHLRREVGHLHYFCKDTALATLGDCGYEVLDWRYTASRLELPNQAFSSRMAALPRRIAHKISPDAAVRLLGGYSLLVLAR